MLINFRLSIPFTPPRPDYLTLEQIVERLPIFGYQLYLNNPASTKEIENNVNTANSSSDIKSTDHRYQLPTFISHCYSLPKTGSSRNLTALGNFRSLILDEDSSNGVAPILNTKARCCCMAQYFRPADMGLRSTSIIWRLSERVV